MSKLCDRCGQAMTGWGTTCSACRKTKSTEGTPTKDRCVGCNKVAYAMERIVVEGQFFHPTCFRCVCCGNKLSSDKYLKSPDGKYYCEVHYAQLVQRHGRHSVTEEEQKQMEEEAKEAAARRLAEILAEMEASRPEQASPENSKKEEQRWMADATGTPAEVKTPASSGFIPEQGPETAEHAAEREWKRIEKDAKKAAARRLAEIMEEQEAARAKQQEVQEETPAPASAEDTVGQEGCEREQGAREEVTTPKQWHMEWEAEKVEATAQAPPAAVNVPGQCSAQQAAEDKANTGHKQMEDKTETTADSRLAQNLVDMVTDAADGDAMQEDTATQALEVSASQELNAPKPDDGEEIAKNEQMQVNGKTEKAQSTAVSEAVATQEQCLAEHAVLEETEKVEVASPSNVDLREQCAGVEADAIQGQTQTADDTPKSAECNSDNGLEQAPTDGAGLQKALEASPDASSPANAGSECTIAAQLGMGADAKEKEVDMQVEDGNLDPTTASPAAAAMQEKASAEQVLEETGAKQQDMPRKDQIQNAAEWPSADVEADGTEQQKLHDESFPHASLAANAGQADGVPEPAAREEAAKEESMDMQEGAEKVEAIAEAAPTAAAALGASSAEQAFVREAAGHKHKQIEDQAQEGATCLSDEILKEVEADGATQQNVQEETPPCVSSVATAEEECHAIDQSAMEEVAKDEEKHQEDVQQRIGDVTTSPSDERHVMQDRLAAPSLASAPLFRDLPAEVREVVAQGRPLDSKDFRGFTALLRAAELGSAEVVQALAQLKANVNVRSDFAHRAPLHYAAAGGHADTLEVLLEHGAEIEMRDCGNNRPLDLARKKGHDKCVETLNQWMNKPFVVTISLSANNGPNCMLRCTTVGGRDLATLTVDTEQEMLANIRTELTNRFKIDKRLLRLISPSGMLLNEADDACKLCEVFNEMIQ